MKISRAILAVVLALSVSPVFANQPPSLQDNNGIVPTQFAQTPAFVGLVPGRVAESNGTGYNGSWQANVAQGTPGLLYAVCVSGGSYGNYAVIMDETSTGIIGGAYQLTTGSFSGQDVNSRQYLITPAIYTFVQSAANGAGTLFSTIPPCWVPPYPVQFNSGLIVVKNTGTTNVVLYYRVNPTNNSANQ